MDLLLGHPLEAMLSNKTCLSCHVSKGWLRRLMGETQFLCKCEERIMRVLHNGRKVQVNMPCQNYD